MLVGIFTSFLIPETKRKTLEELAGEVPGTKNYDPISAGHTGERYSVAEGAEASSNSERDVEKAT